MRPVVQSLMVERCGGCHLRQFVTFICNQEAEMLALAQLTGISFYLSHDSSP